MARLKNDFTGQTAGTTVTAANSGSLDNDALNNVNMPTGSTITYESLEMASGYPSIRAVTGATAAAPWIGWNLPTLWSTMHSRFAVRLNSNPASSQDIFQVLTLVPTTNRARIRINPAGTVSIVNNSTSVATTTATIPLNTPVVIEASFTMSTSADGGVTMNADGNITVKFYQPGSAPLAGATVSSSGIVTTSTSIGAVRLINPVGGIANADIYVGAFAVDDSVAIGPLGAINAAPLVDAGLDASVSAGTAFSRVASATDSDGTIASYAWALTSSPAGSTATIAGAASATVSITPDIVGTYVLTCTATDNSGATGNDSFTLTASEPPAIGGKNVRANGAWKGHAVKTRLSNVWT